MNIKKKSLYEDKQRTKETEILFQIIAYIFSFWFFSFHLSLYNTNEIILSFTNEKKILVICNQKEIKRSSFFYM